MGVFVTLFSIFLFYLNMLHPYMAGDDYMFLMKMPADGSVGTERITSFSDFIESQVNIFRTCHYRVLVHTLIQFFLLLPKWFFDLANTVALLLTIRLVIPKGMQASFFLKTFAVVFCFVWLFHPDLGNAYFWTTGAINYTWTLIPLLLYTRSLVDILEEDKGYKSLLLLSPLVASCNENALISLFVTTGLLFLWKWKSTKKLNKYLFFAAMILFLGGLIMVFSPSAAARLAREGFHYEGLSWRLLEFGKRSAYYLVCYSSVCLLWFVFRSRQVHFNKTAVILFGIIGLSLLSMIAVPIFEPRSSVFGFFVSIYLFLHLMRDSKSVSIWVLALLIFMSCVIGVHRVKVFYKTHEKVTANYETLERSKGQSSIQLPKQCDQSDYHFMVCYEIDERDSYINQSLENYYRIQSVSLKEAYSRNDQWHKLKSEFTRGSEWKGFVKQSHGVFIKKDEIGTHILFDLGEGEFSADKTTILRGLRKSNFKHSLIRFLPNKFKIYFLDFLEYTGTYYKDGKAVLYKAPNGNSYAYHLVYHAEKYDHFYYSLYSLKNHAQMGEIKKLVIQ